MRKRKSPEPELPPEDDEDEDDNEGDEDDDADDENDYRKRLDEDDDDVDDYGQKRSPVRPPPPQPELQPGQLINGRYQVLAPLGRSTIGISYRVNDTIAQQQLALKTINKYCISETLLDKFQHEERTAFTTDHPNVNAILDFGSLGDKTPFFVSEVVSGETLAQRIKREGYLSVELVVPIFVQVCLGLAHLHERGLDHRDIKPTNIMIVRNHLPPGRAPEIIKIVDFGIGKYLEREGGEFKAFTKTGELFGNPRYMSPEQCSGGWIDQYTDTYAVGCVLMESLVGSPPYPGDEDEALTIMMQHQSAAAPTLKERASWMGRDFPNAIEQVLAKMLAKSASFRYGSLDRAAQDLAAIATAMPATSKTANSKASSSNTTSTKTSGNTAGTKTSSNNILVLLVGLAVICACAVAVLTHLHH